MIDRLTVIRRSRKRGEDVRGVILAYNSVMIYHYQQNTLTHPLTHSEAHPQTVKFQIRRERRNVRRERGN